MVTNAKNFSFISKPIFVQRIDDKSDKRYNEKTVEKREGEIRKIARNSQNPEGTLN